MMATNLPSELEVFYQFLAEQLQNGASDLSPEQSVEAFRSYQRDLERLKNDIRPAVEQFKRGEGRQLDYDALKDDVTKRLAEKDITECRALLPDQRRHLHCPDL